MKKRALATILIGAIAATAAQAQEPERLRWVELPESQSMTVSIWDIDRSDFVDATTNGPETLRARLHDVQPQTLVTGRYGVEELATSGTRIPYPAWHGPYSAFDGMSLKVEPSSEIRGLNRLIVTEDRIEPFLVLIDDVPYVRSEAMLRLTKVLDPSVRPFGLLRAVPTPIRDAVYGWTARNRRRIIRSNVCPVPSRDMIDRMLP